MNELKDKKMNSVTVIKCPKCGNKISMKSVAKTMGAKGGRVSSEAKREAAKAREDKKRKEREEGQHK